MVGYARADSATAATKAKSRPQARGARPRVTKTNRDRRSLSRQSRSSNRGWGTCWTKWTTTGPRHSAIATRPLTRNRSGPRGAGNTAMAWFESRPAERLFEDQREAGEPVRLLDPPTSKLRRGAAGSPSSDDNEVHNASMFLEAASCRREVQTRTPTFERTTRGY